MPAHIYFDLDGTLTDPYEGITKCILYALDKLDFPHPSDEYLLSCIGPPLYDTFPELVGQELTLRAVDLYRERFNDVGWQENEPYDGIHEALAELSSRGHVMFVATSKPWQAAERIVLDGTRSGKVELLRYAIGKNPVAENRFMIGDRKHDLVAAVANNIQPIGVSYGYGSVKELRAAGAVSIAARPAELPGLIR